MKINDIANLEERAVSLIKNSNRKIAITPIRFQRDMGITNPGTARKVLTNLYNKKFLLKPGRAEVYYLNPNPPRALSPYNSRTSTDILRVG